MLARSRRQDGSVLPHDEGDAGRGNRRIGLARLRIALVAPAIYGLIVSSGVMASAGPGVSLARLAIAVLVTVFVYWVAEQYAAVLAARLAGHASSGRQVRASLREGWPMVEASYAPLLVLLLAWLLGASRTVAVLSALVFTTLLLFTFGWMAGRRGGLSGLRLLGSALVGGGLGLVMIVLKVALH
jgi:hypothetical protein